ncbi:MAG: hypothetical protein HY308_01495 [Gammaproteobacteria bacterium]|nr:hypothetical protein [Gammaproteobacteria bacterium]
MQNLGMLLLAIYLILQGIKSITGVVIPFDQIIMGVIAIVTGVFLIMKK